MPNLVELFNSDVNIPETRFYGATRSSVSRSANVYPLSELTTLFSDNEMANGKSKFRYLVDLNYDLWFAREGYPSQGIPAHGQMATSNACIAAGNIKFSPDHKVMELINNQSGDFKPKFDSVKWLLAILFANEENIPFALPDILNIDERNERGGDVARHELAISDIKTRIGEVFTPELLMKFKNQPTEIKNITSEAETPRFRMKPFSFFSRTENGDTSQRAVSSSRAKDNIPSADLAPLDYPLLRTTENTKRERNELPLSPLHSPNKRPDYKVDCTPTKKTTRRSLFDRFVPNLEKESPCSSSSAKEGFTTP